MYVNANRSKDHKDTSLAVAFREGRKSRHWSIQQAADACGYSEQQWRNFERDQSLPAIERLQSICDTLEINPLRAFRFWAAKKLCQPESSDLRGILSRLEERPKQDGGEAIASPVEELQQAVSLLPMDEETRLFSYQVLALMARHRKTLTAPHENIKDLRVKQLPDNLDDIVWAKFEGLSHVSQNVVGYSKKGLGYLSTRIKVDAGCGVFHQHIENRYLDAGTEFFSVVRGEGYGIIEHPTKKGEWRVHTLAVGTSGLFRGSLGHTYINLSDEPLLIAVVCVPFPPKLQLDHDPDGSTDEGYARGIEFRIDKVVRTALPKEIKHVIQKLCHGYRHEP